MAAPSWGSAVIPDIVFCFYELMFCACATMIVVGGSFERGRIVPSIIFGFLWATLCYCPISYWTWNANGWLFNLPALDFAGGGPVHMTSGAGALAYALMCGKRHDPVADGLPIYKPHSINTMVLGTIFLWFGWFGFNGGSSGNATIRGFYAAANTNLAAACGALSWMYIDYFRRGRKWTTAGLCSGAVAGLVGITPAAGFVPIYTAVPIGFLTAAGANYAVGLKHILHIDDGLDVFALHGVGGFIGSMCTGLFAADYVAALDGATVISGGWMNHHYVQLGYQLAGATATLIWSFGISCIILFTMNHIPYLKLRMSLEDEVTGTDEIEIGEIGYDWEAHETASNLPGLVPSRGDSLHKSDGENVSTEKQTSPQQSHSQVVGEV